MTDIVIVFHSGDGHAAQVAQAVAETSGATLLPIDANGERLRAVCAKFAR